MECSPNISGEHGRHLLHYAAEQGHLHIVKYLIDEQRCDPSCLDRYEQTPLHRAAHNGHLAIVKDLSMQNNVKPHEV